MSRYKKILNNESVIFSNVNSLLRNSTKKSVQEATTLTKTETPEFKEGLVVYFSGIDNDSFKRVKEKLNSQNTNYKIKPALPSPTSPELYDGSEGKSFGLIQTAVKHLNEDELSPRDKEFYFNGFSIAEQIRKNYSGPVIVDRGKVYSSIRSHAVSLIKKEYEISTTTDKWCPADVYIYNKSDAPTKALSAKSINQGKDSLNALFQTTDKKKSSGILGISLKEEKAQAGKASSFKKVLNKKENYKPAPGLPETLENIMLLFYNLRVAKETGAPTKSGKATYNLQNRIDSVKYLVSSYNAVNKLIKLGMKGKNIKNLVSQLGNILEKQVGKSILNSSKIGDRYDSKKIKAALEQKYSAKYGDLKSVPEKSHILDKNVELLKLATSSAVAINEEVLSEYEKQRKVFVNVLKKQGFSKPTTDGKPLTTSKVGVEIETIETLLKKARCYSTAEWIMSGLNTESLSIPPAYKSIMKQKNAFVALTAFAIGMAGVSPTFFKYVGNKAGGPPKVEPFWGNGFLNLEGEASEVKIIDNPSNKGFSVVFNTNVTLEDAPGSDVVGKYKVTLDFRYAGDQINIEVQDLMGQH
jgi:hypothetical protein